MNSIKNNKNTIALIFIFGLMLIVVKKIDFILYFTRKTLKVLTPIFTGCFIAYCLNILVVPIEKKFLNNKKLHKPLKRLISTSSSFLILASIVVIILEIVIPELINAITIFAEKIPRILTQIKLIADKYSISFSFLDNSSDHISKEIINGFEYLTNFVSSKGIHIISFAFSKIASFFMALILSFYIIFSKEDLTHSFKRFFKRWFNESFLKKFYNILIIGDESLKSFIIGQSMEAVILGLLCSTGLFIFKFPFPFIIGFVIGFTGLVPVVGALVGGIFGFFMILSVSPIKSLLFLIYLIVIQQVENHLIYPKVVGKSVGLPGIWVMISVLVAGGFFGIAGVFLSVPFTATLYKIISLDLNNYEIKQKDPLKKGL